MLRPVVSLLRIAPSASAILTRAVCRGDTIAPVMQVRMLHLTSNSCAERRDLRTYRLNAVTKDEGTAGEKSADIDGFSDLSDIFPDVNTPNRLFDGIPFKELPIFNIKVTSNNTIMTLTDFKGAVHIIRSCGIEGFKKAKKGTNIAAQSTAITMCSKALALGVRTARVRVQGLGPGRLAAIKGLQMGGMKIVSITDNTHVSWCPPRPRKQRRV